MTNNLAYSKLYRQWKTMRYCCDKPRHPMFLNYGALGISYSSEWSDYVAFEKWAITNGYKDGYSLCRKNRALDFSPTNCFWSPKYSHHGLSNSSLYTIWSNMISRCFHHSHKSFMDYGGRGISVAPEWLDFIPFKEWALANGYKKGLTIDSINNNGNYMPTNCRWVDMTQQSNNRRSNRHLTYNGKTLTCSQWSRELGISRHVISCRIKRGLPVEEILRKELHVHRGENHRQNLITFQGLTLNQKQWADKIGISPTTLGRRLKRMTVEEALTTPKSK